jgi:beta-galactosidase
MPRNSHLAWNVIYESGTLEAFGYRGGQCVATAQVATTGPAARIVLTRDRATIDADGEDVASVTVSVIDEAGRAVPTADNLIRFELSGPGKMLGVGNGDPSSHESEIVPYRSLFNGLALVLVQSTQKAGEIRLVARGDGLSDAKLVVETVAGTVRRWIT